MRRWVLVLSGLLFFTQAEAGAGESPSGDWRTIETLHFRVHFRAPLERFASRAASALEGVNARVTEYVGFEPKRRIDILVADPAADANGIAFPFLDRPYIELWATPPEPEEGLGDFRDWTEILVTHEFAHIVHLTRPRNRPGWLLRMLPLPIGPVFYKAPRWLAEGYATLVEGALTGSGRPGSSYRAMVLRRFAIEGKLPSYGALDGESGWLGGSMAYLVGSSYLEWLESRSGPGSLRNLWKRMASRRGGGFVPAFRGVFGSAPGDLYDRFRAEVTARALEQEKSVGTAGLVAGEKWQRLEGGTAAIEVSPDGTRLLARRAPRLREASLAVWTLASTPGETAASAARQAREREILADPNEVPDRPEGPEPRSPRWTLPRIDAHSPESPRWMPDGRSVLFTLRMPDSQGVLHRDLFVWVVESGRVSRVTHLADVSDADPAPGGAWAVAVRHRFGSSELVRVEIASGRVSSLAPPGDPAAWNLWSHPRISPDGSGIAALFHHDGRWRLMVIPVGSPAAARELPAPGRASVFTAPAWSPDGSSVYAATDASGVWNVAIFDAGAASAPPREITRVTGGAFSPAPGPDGSVLYFLDLTAKGVDIRRLDLPRGEALASLRIPPLLAPPPADAPALSLPTVGPSRRYRAAESHVVRAFSSLTVGPDGSSYLAGAQGTDVVGRVDWIAAAGFGDAAGPRGGTLAVAWKRWPIEIRAQAFSALERPGAQGLAPRPELDQERRGGALSASWRAIRPWGFITAEAWGGASRVESLAQDRHFDRSLSGARAGARFRRTRGKAGFAVDGEIQAEVGRTAGSSWSGRAARLGLSAFTALGRLSVSARAGRNGGSPTLFDRFAVGGAASSLLPPSLDRNRIESPALPAAAQIGDRFEGGRAEICPASGPFLIFAERWRAWDGGSPRSGLLRLEGLELRLDRLIPVELSAPLSIYVGAARVRSAAPRFDATRAYAGLVYRP